MPEPITAPTPKAVKLHGPKVRRSFWSGSSDAAINASMLFLRKMLKASVLGARRGPASRAPWRYRLRWPWACRLIFFFIEPRATPAARFALGAAFLRAARFTFFRSVLSVICLVFAISLFSILRIFRRASSSRTEGN